MPLFMKRRVPVEAFQLPKREHQDTFPGWLFKQLLAGNFHWIVAPGEDMVQMDTGHGVASARIGDWIIRDIRPNGQEFIYPCAKDVFDRTYEAYADEVARS